MKHKREKKEILGDLAPHIGRPRTRAGSWGVPSASYRISPIHLLHLAHFEAHFFKLEQLYRLQ